MSMPARRPDPSNQQPLSLWSADEEPIDSTQAAAADQPAAGTPRTLTPAVDDLSVLATSDSAAPPPASAEFQPGEPAARTASAEVAVLAAQPRPVTAPPRPGRGGLRLGLGGRSTASLGGDTRNGNGSSARGPLSLARAGLRALEVRAMRAAVLEAVSAATRRSRELGQQ